MSAGTNRPFDADDPNQFEAFRMAVAGIVRDLLSAVNQRQPELIAEEDRRQWWDRGNTPSNQPIEILLINAAANLRTFPAEFGGSLDSWRDPDEGEAPSPAWLVEQLRILVMGFADSDELDAVARDIKRANRQNRDRLPIDWAALCTWQSVGEIRRLLDTPADFPPSPPAQTPSNDIELVATTPLTIRCGEIVVINVRSGVWKFLEFLLSQPSHSAHITDLFGPHAVWEDRTEDEDVNPRINDYWSRVYSRIRDTKQMFKSNGIPFTIKPDKKNQMVYLIPEKISPLETSKPSKRKGGTRSKAAESKTSRPAKKSTVKKKPAAKKKPTDPRKPRRT